MGDAIGAGSMSKEQQPSEKWLAAAQFVDTLPRKRETRFANMSKAQIKQERLRKRGLL